MIRGLNEKVQVNLAAARKIEKYILWWKIEPRMDLIRTCDPNTAYLSAKTGIVYVVYFPEGGEAVIDLEEYTGPFKLKWMSVESGEWYDETIINDKGETAVSTSDSSGWVAVICRG